MSEGFVDKKLTNPHRWVDRMNSGPYKGIYVYRIAEDLGRGWYRIGMTQVGADTVTGLAGKVAVR
jgi:hypothetical protein